MSHQHNIYDTDTHFSINPITRAIKNTSSGKTVLIQGDHNSERFTFEIPRFIEGHDMSISNKVEIQYTNISSDKTNVSEDVYIADDVQISPDSDDVVIFSWLVSGNATKYAGTLNFSISFKCLTDTRLDYAWGTAYSGDISIGKGRNNSTGIINDSDVLEAWKKELLSPVAEIVDATLVVSGVVPGLQAGISNNTFYVK